MLTSYQGQIKKKNQKKLNSIQVNKIEIWR